MGQSDQADAADDVDIDVNSHLLAVFPHSVRRFILTFLNFEYYSQIYIDYPQNHRKKKPSLRWEEQMSTIGTSGCFGKVSRPRLFLKRLYGYFFDDITRSVFLVSDMIRLHINFHDCGSMRLNTREIEEEDLELTSRFRQSKLSDYVPQNRCLRFLSIGGDQTWLHQNVDVVTGISPEIRELQLQGGRHMSDTKLIQLLDVLPKLRKVEISQRGFNPPRPVLRFADDIVLRVARIRSIFLYRIGLSADQLEFFRSEAPEALLSVQSENDQIDRTNGFKLEFIGCEFADLGSLAGGISARGPRLVELRLAGCPILDHDMIMILESCAVLQTLRLDGCDRLTDVVGSAIGRLASLRVVDVSSTGIRAKGLLAIVSGNRNRIRSVTCDGFRPAESVFEYAPEEEDEAEAEEVHPESGSSSLEKLRMWSCELHAGFLRALFRRCPCLSFLDHNACSFPDRDDSFAVIFQSNSLKKLICSQEFTRECAEEHLPNSPLQELTLFGSLSEVNDSGRGDAETTSFIKEKCLNIMKFWFSGRYMFEILFFDRETGEEKESEDGYW